MVTDLLAQLPILSDAACAGMAPTFDVALPHETDQERGDRYRRALRVCARCPVLAACARYADTFKAVGVWGGRVLRAPGAWPQAAAA